jgi:hypothetical protein
VENKNRDYVACLKNAVNSLVLLIYKMNFRGFFLSVFTYADTGQLKVK